MFKSIIIHRAIFAFLLLLFAGVTAFGQGTAFTYQGRLTDSGNPADGLFDMRFKLFDTADVGTGTQLGVVTNPSVQVQTGAFSVQLDFAPCASCFDGSARFLEISLRPAGSVDPYTVLSLRQPITSAPYALRALDATQLGGVAATGFIRNTTSQQAGTDFNISGSGTAGGTLTGGVINAVTQYNINGLRMLAANGLYNGFTVLAASNTFMGESAGLNTIPNSTPDLLQGKFNSFFGANAGKANTTGRSNSFFGALAGEANTTSGFNSFFGNQAGRNNDGSANSFFGQNAGVDNVGGNNSFFGTEAGRLNSGSNNSFFGTDAGFSNAADNNSFFGYSAGSGNSTGSENTYFGFFAGIGNRSGSKNTMIGAFADVGSNNLTNATAIGHRARVDQSNSIVLGGITGINGGTSVKVGIGTTAPTAKLTLSGTGDFNISGAARLDLINTAAPASYSMHVTDAGLWQVATTSGTSRLAIDSSGNIGIGTTTPSASLHVSRDTSNVATPVAIIESAGSQAPLAFRSEGAEVARIRADNLGNLVLATLTGLSKNIVFRAGEDSGTDLIIQSTGNVGIGDTTPVDKLDVEGDIRVGTGTTGCVKDADASVIAGTCSSDARLKHSVTPFPETLDKLIKLRPVHFYWRADEYKDRAFGAAQSFGLIAQEVEQVMPELVTEDEQGYKAVNYSKLPLLMLQAIKELKAENDSLKQRLDQLTDQQVQLKQQQTQLENLKKIVCLAHPHTEACK